MKSILQLRDLQNTLSRIPLMKMQTEKQYAFESLKPLHHIVEAYHIIIGRLHVLDERNFQTLFEQGMEELYEHLSLIHNASSNILQREYHNDFHYYLQSSILDALERCTPPLEDSIIGNTDKRTVLN
jgi:hypothetical protein